MPGRSELCACTDGRAGAQLCGADGTYGPCVCMDTEFDRIRKGIVARWRGFHTDPWGEPFLVEITFEENGHYSGRCGQASCRAPVFYWGSDADSPLKTYQLRDLAANGTASGIINIFADAAGFRDLEVVSLSADGRTLTFEVWNDNHGPVSFDLRRLQ